MTLAIASVQTGNVVRQIVLAQHRIVDINRIAERINFLKRTSQTGQWLLELDSQIANGLNNHVSVYLFDGMSPRDANRLIGLILRKPHCQ